MKILYSDIKKIVPSLKATPQQIGEFLTMAGFLMDGFEKVKYQGKTDYSISLEVRHNRADCLSVIGFANEIAAKWNLKANYPKVETFKAQKSENIKVTDGKYITRVLAYEIDGICNKKSPEWLVEWLGIYGMNSKNLLVDLSNYVMLITGHPSHLLDLSKMKGKLYWDMNKKYRSITTLDGTLVNLTRDREIILRDEKNILALAGIVGGKKAELDLNTTSIIAEMAVYDPGTVRKNSVGTKVTTEASTRLSRWLDPNGLDYAMNLLVTLILKNCDGKKAALKQFNYYPKKYSAPKINFDPTRPGIYAGIDISSKQSIEILKNLRFSVKKSGKNYIVIPPTDRMDVTLEEDLIEEVTRLYGFEKIPTNEIPKLEVTPDITPRIVKLADKTRDILAIQGFDEILSSPLTAKDSNKITNYLDWKLVTTQNAVNEEYPDLRQSIGAGLLNQLQEYKKKNLAYIQIFEIGKTFGQKDNRYQECESLGALVNKSEKKFDLNNMRQVLESTLRYLGVSDINYQESKKKPGIANPYACFDVLVKDQPVGIIYKSKPQEEKENIYFFEVNLSTVSNFLPEFKSKPAVELTKKLVTLDANIELGVKEPIYNRLEELKKKIGPKNLWSIEVKDAFPVGNKVKYTVRVSYKELDDPDAKKLHLKIFSLNK